MEINKVVTTAKEVIFCYALIAFWAFVSSAIVSAITGYPMSGSFRSPYEILPYAFFGCFFAPLWEELLFRKSVIDLARTNERFVLPFITISSIIFGWLHGNGPQGVLVQGGMGFIFSYCYYTAKSTPYLVTTLAHALWNTTFLLFPH